MKMQLHERKQILAQFDLLDHHLHLLRRVANGLLSPEPAYLDGLLLTVKSETEFIVGELMNALGAIWVRRGEVDRESLRSALEVLKAGGVIGMSPEGTRSRTGGLLEGKIGAAYLASRADAPLVPVALAGTEIGLPSVFRLTRPRLTVTIGKPFCLPGASPRADRSQLQAHTGLIMRTLAAMLPEKLRGAYRDTV